MDNVASGYSGTVRFTSTDGKAILPANTALGGTGTFSATLETVGPQTITATDIATAWLTGSSSSIQVPAPASGFTPTGDMRLASSHWSDGPTKEWHYKAGFEGAS